MRVLVMNGNPGPERPEFDKYCDDYAEGIARVKGNEARCVRLRDRSVKYCTGCWSCWWATPGLCVHRDDMDGLYRTILGADLVVWASPLVFGAVSVLVKKTQDRLIPLIHPFIELSHGECHHLRRYPTAMNIGLILGVGQDDGPDDIAGTRAMFERLALNMRGKFMLFAEAGQPVGEAIHETLGA